jgi:hypothetical protein
MGAGGVLPAAVTQYAPPQGHVKLSSPDFFPFLLNLHRFLDWATDLLAASLASTIKIRGALGLGVATASPEVVDHFVRANFPNYDKGACFAIPFIDLLGRGMFLADGRLWSL